MQIPKPKSRTTALILAVILGGFAVHRFYLSRFWSGTVFVALFVMWVIGAILSETQNSEIGDLVGLLGILAWGFWWLFDVVAVASGLLTNSNGDRLKWFSDNAGINMAELPSSAANQGDHKMGRSKYTEEFRRSVAEAAMEKGATLKSVGERFSVSPTLVRNWKIKFSNELVSADGEETALDNNGDEDNEGLGAVNLVWHIDRAKFQFDNQEKYEEWKGHKKVFFEFSPGNADDSGEDLFADPNGQEAHFEVTKDKGDISVSIEDEGPVISAWVHVQARVNEEFEEDRLFEWSGDMGGWASSTIDLGEYEATILEDDGGDWRLAGSDGISDQEAEGEGVKKLKVNAGWEIREGRVMCRWILVWNEIDNASIAGALGGYSGGGTFQLEQFYGKHSGGTLSNLLIDIEDKITGEEVDFFDAVPGDILSLCDDAQDLVMEWNDADEWGESEQLLLLEEKTEELALIDDMYLLSQDQSPFIKTILELGGITASPS
jgi:hypothetical protein